MSAVIAGAIVGLAIGVVAALINGTVEYDRGYAAGRIRGAREVKRQRPATDRGSYAR